MAINGYKCHCCLRYCKSTIFQANHNYTTKLVAVMAVVCDTAKVRFFKQITTTITCWYYISCCLRYCKSTIFQANHNSWQDKGRARCVVCDTAKVRFFKQITTRSIEAPESGVLFAILQKYDFSSKSQRPIWATANPFCCLRYCKSTIFQANHNFQRAFSNLYCVVCDTAKVRFFKQITTCRPSPIACDVLFAILQKYDFSSKSQPTPTRRVWKNVVCDTAKVRFFKQITTGFKYSYYLCMLFAILQKYDFSSKSQPSNNSSLCSFSCLRYCKSTIFQANHNRRWTS